MNWDEGRNDGVFNDAAGDLCIASSLDTTSTDITDITGLLVNSSAYYSHSRGPVPLISLSPRSLFLCVSFFFFFVCVCQSSLYMRHVSGWRIQPLRRECSG